MSLKGTAMTNKVLRGKIKDIHQIEDVEALYAEAEEVVNDANTAIKTAEKTAENAKAELNKASQGVLEAMEASYIAAELSNKAAENANEAAENANTAVEGIEWLLPLEGRLSGGKMAVYSISVKSGWRRVANIIRGTSGMVEFVLGCNYPYRRMQQVGFDFSGYVKYPNQQDGKEGDNRDTKPVFIKRYQNEFGIAESYDNPQARVTKLRIAYPVPGAEYPLHENPTLFLNNPINCYLDMYIEFDETRYHGGGLPELNFNFSGYSDSYRCEPINEETDATDTGMWGEELTFYEVNIDTMEEILTTADGCLSANNIRSTGGYGVVLASDGCLQIKGASTGDIDTATNAFKPITSSNAKYVTHKYCAAKVCDEEVSMDDPEAFLVGITGEYIGQMYLFSYYKQLYIWLGATIGWKLMGSW